MATRQPETQQDPAMVLPQHLVFQILTKLPAESLHYKARFACKSWASIIGSRRFIQTHHRLSKPVLLIQNHPYSLPLSPSPKLRVVCCCEGLSLLYDVSNHALYIGNPLTMQFMKLPPPPDMCDFSLPHSRLARPPHSAQFVVVCPCTDPNGLYHFFTLGVGTTHWRDIQTQISKAEVEIHDIYGPASVGGVVYCSEEVDPGAGVDVFAIDLADDTTHRVPAPSRNSSRVLLAAGKDRVSYVMSVRDLSGFEIYILEDLRRGEWAALHKISSIAPPSSCFCVIPVAWMEGEELLVLENAGVLVFHSLKDKKVEIFEGSGSYSTSFFTHLNSLITW